LKTQVYIEGFVEKSNVDLGWKTDKNKKDKSSSSTKEKKKWNQISSCWKFRYYETNN
jgi:hypothetical protein